MTKTKKQKSQVQLSNQLSVQEKDDRIRADVITLIDTAQKCHADQSATFSQNSRKIIWAIIGTNWVLIFSNNKIDFPNAVILISILLNIFYLILDCLHYYLDTNFYYNISKEIPREDYNVNTPSEYNKIMEEYSSNSLKWFKIKAFNLLVNIIIFIVGLIIII